MGLTGWFTLGMKKNKNVTIEKIKDKSVDMGTMAAGNPSKASMTLAGVIDQKNAPTKVLMVQDGEYMVQVTDYALKMAQRLDCDIIALDVTDKPLKFSGERKIRETDRFFGMAQKNGEQFIAQAARQGVTVEQIMDIGEVSEVVAQVSGADAGIRYVLSKPEEAVVREEQDRVRVPVFDLRCSRL